MTLFPALVLMACQVLAAPQAVDATQTPLVDFSGETLPDFVVLHDTTLERIPFEKGHARRVHFNKVDWPNVFFQAPGGAWDWREYTGVAVALYNPGEESVTASMRVDNPGGDGYKNSSTSDVGIPPKGHAVLTLRFNTQDDDRFWGMRGVPGRGPRGTGAKLDPSKISAFQVFLGRPAAACDLVFEKAYLFGKTGAPIAMPFIDRFGQYRHAQWPGKLKNERQLAQRRTAEARQLKAHPQLQGRDAFGGWAEGPQREATGWFRTEKIDGKWWLVTPEGHLFFSVGVDCVNLGELTFVEGRDGWFADLPARDQGVFAPLYAQVKGAHSGAEKIGGQGWAFSFYGANLLRKYGEDWKAQWRENAYARLRGWGFNTIANWSQGDVLENSTLPYVVSTSIDGVRLIEGGTGYWSKMKDVFAPEFEARAEAAFQWVAGLHAKSPLCIGYFADNELAWEGIQHGVLESPSSQPCRQCFVADLQAAYGDIKGLNAAWGTNAESWDALRTPGTPNARAQADLDAFLYRFARRYFDVVSAACHKYAPHQLYLGCRFAGPPRAEVERACADVADVMSYNLYYSSIPSDRWVGEKDLGKPIVIGEFHFGALDRGMFHTGLRAAANQKERAECYERYVRSVASHPAFVGCHWFQYVDEPVTGRWFDGENYNIGFVDVTDTPYREMLEAARRVHGAMYTLRYGTANTSTGTRKQ